MDLTQRYDNLAVVFVGCGGTYWTAANFFCCMLQNLQPKKTFFVDPDFLTYRNLERQWCQEELNVSKAGAAAEFYIPSWILRGGEEYPAVPCIMDFLDWAAKWTPELDEMDVLLIVNVDNDAARLAIRQWCKDRIGRSVMVMSGCDTDYGQVYYGVYDDGIAFHDWRPLHPDVGGDAPPVQDHAEGCGAQTIQSNFLTGALFGPAIDEAVQWLGPRVADLWGKTLPTDVVSEWYWRRNKEGQTKVWTMQATPFFVGHQYYNPNEKDLDCDENENEEDYDE